MSPTKSKMKAPKHLKAATGRWWEAVCDGWNLEDHHRRLLTLAAEAWDRSVQCVKRL